MERSLVRRTPFESLLPSFGGAGLFGGIDDLFGLGRRLTQLPLVERSQMWTPALDVAVEGEEIVARVDLPGMHPEAINVSCDDGLLTISGERQFQNEDTRAGMQRIERVYGQFVRTLRLPEGVEAEDVKASYANGVLELRLPKPEQPEASGPTRIPVSFGEQPSEN